MILLIASFQIVDKKNVRVSKKNICNCFLVGELILVDLYAL